MGGMATHHITAAGSGVASNAGRSNSSKAGAMGDASTAGEAISSAIVKYNYQAQQVL